MKRKQKKTKPKPKPVVPVEANNGGKKWRWDRKRVKENTPMAKLHQGGSGGQRISRTHVRITSDRRWLHFGPPTGGVKGKNKGSDLGGSGKKTLREKTGVARLHLNLCKPTVWGHGEKTRRRRHSRNRNFFVLQVGNSGKTRR